MSGFNLDDYVDVAERIRLFYDKYPDGRLTTVIAAQAFHVGERTFVWCQAAAYRTADDTQPAIGTAWEPIPGATPYTRDSELMNAETAAWGRAIIAAGIPSKKIASADEVKARTSPPAAPKANGGGVSKAQHAKIGAVIKDLQAVNGEVDWVSVSRAQAKEQFGKTSRADLTAHEAGALIEYLEKRLKAEEAAQAEAQEIPF